MGNNQFLHLVEQAVLFPFVALDRDSLSKRYVLVHLHIPKTAGVALVSRLSKHLVKQSFDFKQIDSAVDEFAGMHSDPPEFITGHIFLEHYLKFMHRLAPKEGVILGVLRDPVDRLMSYYNYCSSPKHPWALEFSEEHLSFANYVRSSGCHNIMSRTLFGDGVRSVKAIENELMHRCYALCSMQRVAEVVGQVLEMRRDNPGRLLAQKNCLDLCYRKVRRAEVDAQTMTLIRERNGLDFELYDTVLKAEAKHRRATHAFARVRRYFDRAINFKG